MFQPEPVTSSPASNMDRGATQSQLTQQFASNNASGQNDSSKATFSKHDAPAIRGGNRRRRNREHRSGGGAVVDSGVGVKPKRPQPRQRRQQQSGRGDGTAAAAATSLPGRKSAVAQDDEFEVGSVFKAGSKKQNLNHLLNFQYEPRGACTRRTGTGRSGAKGGHTSRHVYNKEQYLQANCQFVVSSVGNYSPHMSDPDTLVDWNMIEQVVLKTTSAVPSCPICLYPPTAAKITRCGHVFCWSCILHYLALSDHAWRKCPICYESIHRQDMKSVVSVPWREFHVGDEIELVLMRRERHSLFAMPVDLYYEEVNEKHPSMCDQYTAHAQLILATPGQVSKNIIARERQELEEQYRRDKDEPEACFIEEALQYLAQRESGIGYNNKEEHDPNKESLQTLDEEEETSASSDADTFATDESSTLMRYSPENITEQEEEEELSLSSSRPRHASSSSDGTSSVEASFVPDDLLTVTAEDLDLSAVNKKQGQQQPKDTFYFYQSGDGQPIFLHALNVQMLVKDHGCLEQCPKTIRGRILEKDHASMTEELRKKLRYLRHMPVTSLFEVCELQMKPPIVSKATTDEFQGQIDARRRKRNKRAREERRRETWIRAEENKMMGKFPDARLRIESAFHFPEVGKQTPVARSTESLVSVDSSVFGTSPNAGRSVDSNDGNVLSFAKMLREGVAKPPSAKALPRSDTFPLLAQPSRRSGLSDSEPEPEDYVPPPPMASFGDALAQAFAQVSVSSSNEGTNHGGAKKKGKKMKGTKILLTSSARPTF